MLRPKRQIMEQVPEFSVAELHTYTYLLTYLLSTHKMIQACCNTLPNASKLPIIISIRHLKLWGGIIKAAGGLLSVSTTSQES